MTMEQQLDQVADRIPTLHVCGYEGPGQRMGRTMKGITREVADLRWIRSIPVLVLIILLSAQFAGPASAGEKYLGGSPVLSVAVKGSNEFYPGDDVSIPVIIQNSGLIEYTFTYPSTLTPADMPSTAKLMVVTLGAGAAPVVVTSDPQMAGDLKGGSNVLVNFHTRVLRDAPSGTYNLPLNISYTYLFSAEQYGLDSLHYIYRETEVNLTLPVHIKPKIIPEVSSVHAASVYAGSEGYLTLEILNAGNEQGKNAVVRLVRSGTSPVTPVSGSNYIGDFPPGAVRTLQYKVSADRDTAAGTYPVDIVVDYTNSEGNTVSTDVLTVGVPVGGKITFEVVTPPAPVNPGSKATIEVAYRNTGLSPVSGAQARLYTVDPFTSGDDLSYLGDMAPGETRDARFEVTVDREATVKEYGFDSEIRYRDTLGNDQVSDRIKVPVEVVRPSGIKAVLGNPFVLLLIAIVVIAGIYLVVTRRRKEIASLIPRKPGEKPGP